MAAPSKIEVSSVKGIRLLTKYVPLPTASVGLFIRGGSVEENRDNSGTTHFLEHLWFKNKPPKQTLAYTERGMSAILKKVPVENVKENLLELTRMVFSEPTAEEVDKEKKNILAEYEYVNSTPKETVPENFFVRLHGGGTILGTKNDIENMSLDKILSRRSELLVPERLSIVVVGKLSHEEARKIVKEVLKSAMVLKGTEIRYVERPFSISYAAIAALASKLKMKSVFTIGKNMTLALWSERTGEDLENMRVHLTKAYLEEFKNSVIRSDTLQLCDLYGRTLAHGLDPATVQREVEKLTLKDVTEAYNDVLRNSNRMHIA